MSEIPLQFALHDKYIPSVGQRYIPPVAHEPREAERRRGLPSNTLILEQQLLGTIASRLFVQKMIESGSHEDLVFGAEKIIAPLMLGGAWYSLRDGTPPVTRRHLNLPVLANERPGRDADTELTEDDIVRVSEVDKPLVALGAIERAEYLADKLLDTQLKMGRVGLDRSHAYGHAIGDAGLWVAVLPHDEIGKEGTIAKVQQQVLQVGMNVFDTTTSLSKKIHEAPSIAMLGERQNDLMTFIRKKGPHGAYNAFKDSQEEAFELAHIA